MSHITKVKTLIRDREILLETLKELGYLYEEKRKLRVGGANLVMDVAIRGRKKFTVGFRREKEDCPYELYFLSVNTKEYHGLRDAVMQRYARKKIVKEAKRRNYIVADERVCSGNRLRLVLRKVA
jgi:Protein of unknown function (DUF1257)